MSWWLWHADKFHQWPASDPVAFAGLLYIAIATPLTLYWTEDIESFSVRVRRVTVAVYLVVYALLGAYSAWVADAPPFELGIRGADMLAAIVLGFVSCRIPDDCIDSKRYPLFMARAVMQGLIESFEQSSTGDKAP